jgi:hypothetical protein
MPSQVVSTVLLPRLSAMHQDPVARYRLTLRSAFLVEGSSLGHRSSLGGDTVGVVSAGIW